MLNVSKNNAIKAFALMHDCLEQLMDSLDTWDADEYDVNKEEQRDIVRHMQFTISQKLKLLDPSLQEGYRVPRDFFPDLVVNADDVVENKFFSRVVPYYRLVRDRLQDRLDDGQVVDFQTDDGFCKIQKQNSTCYVLSGDGFDQIVYNSLDELLADTPELIFKF